MRRFVYKVTTTGSSKYGGQYQYATIYQVKRNELYYIGETRKWRTSSYMGKESEVNAWLLENKYIPKNWSIDIDNLKTRYYRINAKYEIKEI